MKKKGFVALLITLLMPSIGLASMCDNKTIRIIGPDHFNYSLMLSKGSIGEKNNGITTIKREPVTTFGTTHQLFSAKGSNGGISGSIFLTNLDTREEVSIPFYLTEMRGGCYISPKLTVVESNTFQAKATSTFGIDLRINIREFKN